MLPQSEPTRRIRGTAITRGVSPNFAACELGHLARSPIDLGRASAQHQAYEDTLGRLGWSLVSLPASATHPDCVFVEDTAVVLDELAIVTRPGAVSRRGEVEVVAAALAELLPVVYLESPATLDGGDVLRLGRDLYVGRSARSSASGLAALAAQVEALGYRVIPVELRDCLHLKTAITAVNDTLLVVNPQWLDLAPFANFELVEVDPSEPFAANVLRLGEVVLTAAAYPRTIDRLAARGVAFEAIEVDEIAKAEGGLTCCSVLIPGRVLVDR